MINRLRPLLARYAAVTAAAIAATVLLGACSLKKNTAASRRYTEFITRYNIYFNGDEHYKGNPCRHGTRL